MSTNRREFIRNISLGTAGITIGGAFQDLRVQLPSDILRIN